MPKLRPMSLKSAMGMYSAVLKINAPIAKAMMLNQGLCEAFISIPYMSHPAKRGRIMVN